MLEVFFVYAAHKVLGLLHGHLQKNQGTVLKETSGDVALLWVEAFGLLYEVSSVSEKELCFSGEVLSQIVLPKCHLNHQLLIVTHVDNFLFF